MHEVYFMFRFFWEKQKEERTRSERDFYSLFLFLEEQEREFLVKYSKMKLIKLKDCFFIVIIFILIRNNELHAASLNKNSISRESGENEYLMKVKENIRQCGYKVCSFLHIKLTVNVDSNRNYRKHRREYELIERHCLYF